MLNPRFVIRVQTVNLRVEIWVNEIPVSFLGRNEARSPVAIPINQFLLKGRNLIQVLLHAGPVPSRASEPWSRDKEATGYLGPASLSLSLAKEVAGQDPSSRDAYPLVTLDWQGAADTHPSVLERACTLNERAGPWAWESAARFASVDAEVRGEVRDYLEYLHRLLTAREFEAFVAESAPKLEELTELAYGVPAESMRRGMLQALEDHSVEPYRLQPLDWSEVDLRLVAGGRMIDCLRKNRRNVLEYVEPKDQDVFFLPTMVGKIGAQWKILR